MFIQRALHTGMQRNDLPRKILAQQIFYDSKNNTFKEKRCSFNKSLLANPYLFFLQSRNLLLPQAFIKKQKNTNGYVSVLILTCLPLFLSFLLCIYLLGLSIKSYKSQHLLCHSSALSSQWIHANSVNALIQMNSKIKKAQKKYKAAKKLYQKAISTKIPKLIAGAKIVYTLAKAHLYSFKTKQQAIFYKYEQNIKYKQEAIKKSFSKNTVPLKKLKTPLLKMIRTQPKEPVSVLLPYPEYSSFYQTRIHWKFHIPQIDSMHIILPKMKTLKCTTYNNRNSNKWKPAIKKDKY